MEGSGEIAACPEEGLTVAAPYTVKIKKLLTVDRIAYSSRNYEYHHVKAREGVLKVGDILVDDASVTYMVIDVDTKAHSFRLPPCGLRRIITEPMLTQEDSRVSK